MLAPHYAGPIYSFWFMSEEQLLLAVFLFPMPISKGRATSELETSTHSVKKKAPKEIRLATALRSTAKKIHAA